ncbi:MAG: hypothetical protein FWE45_02625 [Firmicutes bacterium]|nr:hypothetical protein [Bacillota bacterium]
MKIKQILSNVAEILGLADVVELVKSNVAINELHQNTNYRLLLRCASLVVANLATHYSEITHTQRVNTQINGRINFSVFEHPPTNIKMVRQITGERMRFRTFIDHIIVNQPGKFDVTFTYVPKIISGNETNPFPLPPAALEYGIMAEYAFLSGMFNEAQVWNEKFGEMIFASVKKNGRSVTMPRSF